ncbi:MAG: hypothetical protein OEZ39_07805 [Gammaproteobacteria bacterium]|nr:hypothetical protein [Gammaproteobacteria bacterium]MDH5651764.1 hypothetical protein [Gammaproteobacteria bacterium]
MEKVELIECAGVAEQLQQQRPEFVRFYTTWKRVFTKSGHKGITQYFPKDHPVDFTNPDQRPGNRVCTVGLLEGPNHHEEFRVHYDIAADGRVYVLEVGHQLKIDNIKF